MSDPELLATETLLAHAGHEPEAATGAIVPPVHSSTSFARGVDYELLGNCIYSRYGGPTGRLVENLAARLDGGADAMVFSSGLAAFAALFETVPTGKHVVAPTIMYHGAHDWLRRLAERRGVEVTFFPPTAEDALAAAVRPGETAVVWIESMVNPTWEVIDIRRAAEIAHEAGAVLGVDATSTPPVTTRPIDLGADLVLHSATKYLNGHGDVLAGVLVTARADDRWAELGMIRKLTGGILGGFEAWLLLRGMRTLAVRFERASATALLLARELEGHPGVHRVLYPGLPSHPSHDVARRQMQRGFGGTLSLLLKGDFEEARQTASRTRVFVPATSFGGVESLIEHRASVEGPNSPVPPNLVRLSIGLEDPSDLLADLWQALPTKKDG